MGAEAPGGVLYARQEASGSREVLGVGVPRHVLIIPDNNRTWAKKHKEVLGEKFIREGYNVGARRIVEVAGAASQIHGLDYLTVNLASRDNIVKRPSGELADLWDAVKENMIDKGLPELIGQGARVRVVGNLEGVREDIIEGFLDLSESSKDNSGLALTFVLGYDYKLEKKEALEKAQKVVSTSGFDIPLTDELIDQHKYLQAAGLPDTIDGVIRTGERRTSGIFPEPLAQAEYAFYEDLTWPEFGTEQFAYAIADLASRKKKGGG